MCIRDRSTAIIDGSLCALGSSAPNPVLSTIRFYREEYESHIRDKRCTASVCATLFNSPCQNTCPANIDIPIYIDLIRQGRFEEAYNTIIQENPFPVVCGRVCHHPCEGRCNRSKLDEPVAIRSLKRFAADYVLNVRGNLKVPATEERREEKVAIIGSGPAGLTAAYYLRRKGYQVTVFEALPVAGGMMAVGIPEYRLPKEVLQAEIDTIRKMGVEIRLNTAIGRDITVDDLKKEGYGAIFIAIGAHKDQALGIPGEELEGVVSGVAFLRDVNLHKQVDLAGKIVAVIGGGNVAMDAARSVLRMGAAEVKVLYRRRKQDMPALPEEIQEAEHEGVKFFCLVAPDKIIGENGRVTGVACTQMKPDEFDKSGRRRPVSVDGSGFTVDADMVIAAIGQSPDLSFLPKALGLEIRRAGTVVVDRKTLATNIPGIYSGGDCVSGPDTVIEAVAAGKKAAASIDRLLGGDGTVIEEVVAERKLSGPVLEEKKERNQTPVLSANQRIGNFKEVELGFNENVAVEEAFRCLRCDVK